jgi:hypothetical protein
MHKMKVITLINLMVFLFIFTQARSETDTSQLKTQPASIQKIIQKEKAQPVPAE